MIGRFFNSGRILQAHPNVDNRLVGKQKLEFFKSFNLSTGATLARTYRESSNERLKDLNDLYLLYINQMLSCQPTHLNFVEGFERSPARPTSGRAWKHRAHIPGSSDIAALAGAGTSPVRQPVLEDAMSLPVRRHPVDHERRQRLILGKTGAAAPRQTQPRGTGGLR